MAEIAQGHAELMDQLVSPRSISTMLSRVRRESPPILVITLTTASHRLETRDRTPSVNDQNR